MKLLRHVSLALMFALASTSNLSGSGIAPEDLDALLDRHTSPQQVPLGELRALAESADVSVDYVVGALDLRFSEKKPPLPSLAERVAEVRRKRLEEAQSRRNSSRRVAIPVASGTAQSENVRMIAWKTWLSELGTHLKDPIVVPVEEGLGPLDEARDPSRLAEIQKAHNARYLLDVHIYHMKSEYGAARYSIGFRLYQGSRLANEVRIRYPGRSKSPFAALSMSGGGFPARDERSLGEKGAVGALRRFFKRISRRQKDWIDCFGEQHCSLE